MSRGAQSVNLRQATFHHGKSAIGGEHCDYTRRLAAAGFIYAGNKNMRVQCVYCLKTIEIDRPKFAFRHPMVVHAEINVNCFFVVERLTGEEKPLEMNKDREQLWKMLMEFDYESRNYHRSDNKGRHTFDRM